MNTDDRDGVWVGTVLERAVGAEPELGFSAEDVLRRALRDQARRRAALTGVLTVTALVAAGLLLGHGGGPHSAGLAAGSTGAVSAMTPQDTPQTTVWGAEGPLVIDAHSRELTNALATQPLVPAGVTTSTDQSYGGQPLTFYKITVGTQYLNDYYAEANLTDQQGATGSVYVRVEHNPDGFTCAADNTGCQTETLADGSHLIALRYTPPSGKGDPQPIEWIVERIRPDGTAVEAACANWTDSIMKATGAQPLIGKDELIKIAELPALNF